MASKATLTHKLNEQAGAARDAMRQIEYIVTRSAETPSDTSLGKIDQAAESAHAAVTEAAEMARQIIRAEERS